MGKQFPPILRNSHYLDFSQREIITNNLAGFQTDDRLKKRWLKLIQKDPSEPILVTFRPMNALCALLACPHLQRNIIQEAITSFVEIIKSSTGSLKFQINRFIDDAMFTEGVTPEQRVDAVKAINAVLGVQDDDNFISRYAHNKGQLSLKLITAITKHDDYKVYKPEAFAGLLEQAKKKLAEQKSKQEISENNPLNTYKGPKNPADEQKACAVNGLLTSFPNYSTVLQDVIRSLANDPLKKYPFLNGIVGLQIE